jgi:hypothetical protein
MKASVSEATELGQLKNRVAALEEEVAADRKEMAADRKEVEVIKANEAANFALAKKATQQVKVSLMKASLHTKVRQDPEPAADAKEPAADAKKEPAADAKEPAADAKAADDAKNEAPADAKAEPAADAAPTEAPGSIMNASESSAANVTANETANVTANATNASNATPAEVDTSCVTKEDARVAAWFTETAPVGSPCVFGIDARDEGGHCIYSGGQYGSNGWCFTNKEQSAWGSCNEHCPLYGAHKKLGDKIEAVTDMVAKVNSHLETQLNATVPEASAANETAAAPAEGNVSLLVAADAKEAAKEPAAEAAPAADAKKEPAADAKAAA